MEENVNMRKDIQKAMADCIDTVATGSGSLFIPLGQARPRPPEFGHFHTHAELFFQLSGKTVFSFPKEICTLQEGQLLLIPALVTHAERAEHGISQPFSNLVFYAGGGFLSVHLARSDRVGIPSIAWPERPASEWAGKVASLLDHAVAVAESVALSELPLGSGIPASTGDACSLVRSLIVSAIAEFAYVLGQQSPAHASRLPRLVQDCRKAIQASISDSALSVARLAEWLRCSPDYLSHLYREKTGESLSAYITRMRLEHAVVLLGETALSVKEISWACGFSGPNYFIRKYKDRYGETPERSRNPGG
jgi:AraC-like DNA-binding protein